MINLKNVVKVYKAKKSREVLALNDISLCFPNKGLIFILGSSGSGKSTLLNILGLLDTPTEGEVSVNGVNINKLSNSELTNYRNNYVGFVFQDYNLFSELNVYDNIALNNNTENTKEKVTYILDKLGLANFEKRKINELSGGEKQRVAIARALIKNPDVILADEPTGNLDTENSKLIFNILKNISEDHLVIVVSHEEELANYYADAIVRLKDGKVIKNTITLMDNSKKDLELKKSHIKFSSKLKLALGIVKRKKIRTGVTAILASIAFALLGFSMSLFNFDVAKMHSETMIHEEVSQLVFNKGNLNLNNFNFNKILSNKDILEITKKLDNYQKISYLYTDNILESFSFGTDLTFVNELSDSVYYNIDFNHNPYFITYSDKDLNDLEIIGHKPIEEREVLIPEYLADIMVARGFYNYDATRNYPFYEDKVSDITELIGQNIGLSDTYVKISGIIKDTKLDKYRPLINESLEANKYEPSKLYQEFKIDYQNPIYFVITEDFFQNTEFTLNNTIDSSVFPSVNIYNSNKYYLGSMYSILNQEIEYYNGNEFVKTSTLNDNTVLLSTTFLDDYYGQDLMDSLTKAIMEAQKSGLDTFEVIKNYYIEYLNNHDNIIGNKITLQIKDDNGFTNQEINNIELTITGIVFNDMYNYTNYNTLKDYILPNELVTSIKTDVTDIDKLTNLFEEFTNNDNYFLTTKFSEEINDVANIVRGIENIAIYIVIGTSLFAIILFTLFISSSITTNKKQIGLLRALGTKIKEIINIYILESLIIGIITFVLSNILSNVIINVINNYITKEVSFYLRPLVFNEETIIVILVSLIVIIIVSLIIPIIHLAKKRPINLIK